MLFSQLVKLFLTHTGHHCAPRTAEFYEGQLKKVMHLIGHLEAIDVQPIHIVEVKPTWHLITSLQRLYRWATEEQQILTHNPLAKLKKVRLGSRKRILGPPETAIFLRAAALDFRRFLLAARECAARPQELRALNWTDLRWQGGYARLKKSLLDGDAFFELTEFKGQKRRADQGDNRIIPISPRLGRLLWRLARGRKLEGLIFRTYQNKAWTRNSLRLRLHRIRKRVDLPLVVGGERVVCYTWRHSSATDLAANGMQTSILQLLLGHANIRTTQRYLHVQKKHLLDAWRRHHKGESPN